MKKNLVLFACMIVLSGISSAQTNKWTEEEAWAWYETVSPLKGFNYLPSTAVNSTEMWQSETFDLNTIDKELALAKKSGYNSARVFLQYIVWQHDPKGFKNRMNDFLSIADKHSISVMFILFDDCAFAGKEPYLGLQDDPVPGVHNSGWTPSPGGIYVNDTAKWSGLEKYLKDVIGSYKDDKRVVVWDLYNEPWRASKKVDCSLAKAAFRWAREVNPTQPLTVAPWGAFYYIFAKHGKIAEEILNLSDIISFHSYSEPDEISKVVEILKSNFHRPIINTEWLFRQNGGTFENVLPIFLKNKVSWYHWGLVAGKTQTYMHWGSEQGTPVPEIWQHDVFHKDGTPYNPEELKMVKKFTFIDE